MGGKVRNYSLEANNYLAARLGKFSCFGPAVWRNSSGFSRHVGGLGEAPLVPLVPVLLQKEMSCV